MSGPIRCPSRQRTNRPVAPAPTAAQVKADPSQALVALANPSQ